MALYFCTRLCQGMQGTWRRRKIAAAGIYHEPIYISRQPFMQYRSLYSPEEPAKLRHLQDELLLRGGSSYGRVDKKVAAVI